MVLAHVKHYLNPEGINFFSSHWFPQALRIVPLQQGFHSIKYAYDTDNTECVNIWVQFDSELTINTWSRSHEHQALVSQLDRYRTRQYEVKRYNIEKSSL